MSVKVYTLLRVTLVHVKMRNVTITLPEDVLRRVKVIAARRETSISAMVAGALTRIADEEEGYAEAARGMMFDLNRGYDLETFGKAPWTRDSLHER